jgi:hypothetical protein
MKWSRVESQVFSLYPLSRLFWRRRLYWALHDAADQFGVTHAEVDDAWVGRGKYKRRGSDHD